MVQAVYDIDLAYAGKLVDYLNLNESAAYETLLFTTKEHLLHYLEENVIDVLMMAKDVVLPEEVESSAREVIYFSEEPVEENEECLFKYCSAKELIEAKQRILRIRHNRRHGNRNQEIQITESEAYDYVKEESDFMQKEEKPEIIGVYSAGGGCGQTGFALDLTKALSKRYKTLYLGFEAVGSSLGVGKRMADMSDLIYCIKQRMDNLEEKLRGFTVTNKDAEYLPSVSHFENLLAMTTEDVDILCDMFLKGEYYQKIVVDIGCFCEGYFRMLERCQRRYLIEQTVGEADLVTDKTNSFRLMFESCGMGEILKESTRLKLPKAPKHPNGIFSEETGEQKTEEEYGRFVWSVAEQI
ncbi:MAG: hypothetical protein K6G65_07070 [Lachnospiraceae bacterium]|nr:hypothetical protein [Lachnospiraceae bacterium]